MKPYLTLGDFSIRSYIVVVGLAVVVLVLMLYFREKESLKKQGVPLSTRHAVEIFILALVLAIAGARLLFVLTWWEELYAGRPLVDALAFWRGGLVFYGGFIAVIAGGLLYCHYRKLPFVPLLDLVLPYLALAYAIGRLGCFLNGCCYGHETDLSWALAYPAVDELSRHPTQLYASFSALFIFGLLLKLKKNNLFPGFVSACFLLLYGTYRFFVEFLRVSEPVQLGLSQAQLISLLLLVTGAAFIVFKHSLQRKERKEDVT